MSLKQFKIDIALLFVGFVVLFFLLLSRVEVGKTLSEATAEDTVQDTVGYVWQYESSPSDRRAMLEGLTAMECIDVGICELTFNLPVAQ